VHREAVDHGRAGLVEADDLHLGALAAELDHHLVQGADGGDVPEVGAADVDADLLDDLLEVEGRDEALGGGKEHLADDAVGAHAALVLDCEPTYSTWPTLWAKKNPDSSTPRQHALGQVVGATTTMTVATIISARALRVLRRSRREAQLKVPMETMIITATSAAIGICATQSPRNTTMISRKTPARASTAARVRRTSR
jgi:hypothetical protein